MIDYELLNNALFWIKIYYELRVLMMIYSLVNKSLDFIADKILNFARMEI